MSKKKPLSQLKLIWPLVVPYKKYVFLALILLILGAATTLSLPVAFKQMIDLGFSPEHQDQLSTYFIAVFIIALLMAVFTSLRYFWVSWIGQKVVADLRKKVYRQVLSQSSSFFERTKTGEILSRINTDTTLVETVVGSTFSVTLRSIVTFIGATVMMIISSPKLASMIALIIPLVVIPIALTGRRIRDLSNTAQEKIAASSALATETINAMHTVQAYAQEKAENKRFHSAVTDSVIATIKRIRMETIMSMLVVIMVFASITLILWMGAQDVINGQMTSGTLAQFVIYAVMASTTTGALTQVWGELQRAAGALQRITELMSTQPEIQNPKKPVMLEANVSGEIRIENMSFAYPSRPDKPVLRGVSLHIKPGETVALVGPSGAGKSTLFQLLMRFYEPQSGSIQLDGTDINRLDLTQLRQQFGLVAQDVTIFSNSAAENIAYGKPDADQQHIEAASEVAHADEFIQQLEDAYATYLGERGVRLSGGQAQRLSIARAVLADPPILLLDEATSALDAESERLVQIALQEMMQNRTNVVIAHRLATIRQADRIVVMDQGEIVAEGSHQELLASNALYAHLAKLQFTDNQILETT